jgi:hypothetical protein
MCKVGLAMKEQIDPESGLYWSLVDLLMWHRVTE